MKKEILRKKYKIIRKNITDKEIKNNIIYNKILHHELINKSDTILIYMSFDNEVDTYKIIEYYLNKKKIAVPKVSGNNMEFHYIKSLTDLKKDTFNIMEPDNNDIVKDFNNSVIIMPGICFDKDNNRCGYGKGYYDRFLENKNIYKIGLSYKECITNKIDTDKYDIKLDEIITN